MRPKARRRAVEATTPRPKPVRVHLATLGFTGYSHNARRFTHFTAALCGI